MKILEKKIKHHYVWAHYLREWCVNNKIFYISHKGKISNDSVKGLAREANFYKIGNTNALDLKIIDIILRETNSTMVDIHTNFALKIINIKKLIESLPNNGKENINDIVSNNLYEDYFSSMEREGIKIIKSLKSGSMDYIVEQTKYYELCDFIAYQFSRTKKMKMLLINGLNENKSEYEKLLKDFYTRNWWFMCSFFAGNLSFDMALNKSKKVYIITNNTNIDFITSDQPVININPDGTKGEYIDYYYPISPKKAILIKTSNYNYFNEECIKYDDVCFLNKKMALNCYDTIFSLSKTGILSNKDFFNNRLVKKLGFR